MPEKLAAAEKRTIEIIFTFKTHSFWLFLENVFEISLRNPHEKNYT